MAITSEFYFRYFYSSTTKQGSTWQCKRLINEQFFKVYISALVISAFESNMKVKLMISLLTAKSEMASREQIYNES